jgi:hypothetical protein
MIVSTQRNLERAGPTLGKSNAANWASRWAKGVPDRANDPKRKPSLENVMDYEQNPNTGTWHEVVQTGDYMGAPVHTRLTPTKDMK